MPYGKALSSSRGVLRLKTSNPLAFNIWRFCAAAPLCQLLLAWKEAFQ